MKELEKLKKENGELREMIMSSKQKIDETESKESKV
jgi:hypothetical protein